MNIAVLGAGAIGSNVAADLAMAGYRPTVIDPWPAQVDALRTRGLKVQLPDGELQSPPLDAYHLCDMARLRRDFDVVLLAVKAQDARWMAEFIAPYVKSSGVVVGLMADEMGDEPGAIAEKLATTLAGHVGKKSRNAVLQDHIKGRRTETNQLNGMVVTQGRAVGIATPANEAVVTVTQRIERGELEPAPTNLALARALLG